MPKYVDYYGQPTESEAVADEAMRRNERDLARAQAEGKAVGVDYFGQPTTDPRAIERGAERNIGMCFVKVVVVVAVGKPRLMKN